MHGCGVHRGTARCAPLTLTYNLYLYIYIRIHFHTRKTICWINFCLTCTEMWFMHTKKTKRILPWEWKYSQEISNRLLWNNLNIWCATIDQFFFSLQFFGHEWSNRTRRSMRSCIALMNKKLLMILFIVFMLVPWSFNLISLFCNAKFIWIYFCGINSKSFFKHWFTSFIKLIFLAWITKWI